jgi:acetyltransferase
VQPHESFGDLTLGDGTVIHFRPVRPEDEPLIAAAFRSASRETLLHRFFSPIRDLAPGQLHQMLTIDPSREQCIVAVIKSESGPRIIAGVRYVRVSKPATAEVALTVHDTFQHLGVGTFLLKLITKLARKDGIRFFQADVMTSNAAMLQLMRKIFPGARQQFTGGDVAHFEVDLGTER